MLFDSTLRKELARNFGATLVVIVTIVLTILFIRTLGQAALGRVDPQDVLLLLAYIGLGNLPLILGLSLFIGVVSTLSRMYRASEMTIWFASGVPLSRFVRPVLATHWPVLLLVAALSLFVWPWQNGKIAELKDQFERRSDLARAAPGQFQTSADGQRTFFFEGEASGAIGARNVFVVASKDGVESVMAAREGGIDSSPDGRYIVLAHGQRNEENAKSGERTVSRFESYRALAGERGAAGNADQRPRSRPTAELAIEPTRDNLAELGWRLGLILAVGNVALLGIGLSAANPRHASNWNLLFAVLAFFVYYNLMVLAQSSVRSGRLGLAASLLIAHGGAFVIAIGLIRWRQSGVSRIAMRTRRPARRRAGASAAAA